jgi:hypothetical protein
MNVNRQPGLYKNGLIIPLDIDPLVGSLERTLNQEDAEQLAH